CFGVVFLVVLFVLGLLLVCLWGLFCVFLWLGGLCGLGFLFVFLLRGLFGCWFGWCFVGVLLGCLWWWCFLVGVGLWGVCLVVWLLG
ncbi:hypothetical protein RA264_27830, partial [Pseudomonas syringae pv. tagetis]|uniref:hypothetical protein n=1 Tax=Pseudomonas syringae group genomosp. 7 TaxID=251699 RepID=UPI00376F87F5